MIMTDSGVERHLNLGARFSEFFGAQRYYYGVLVPLPRTEDYGNHTHMPWNYLYVEVRT